MPLKPEFVMEMRTKTGMRPFVLFAGLLDLAHENQVIGIETEVLIELCNPEKEFWVVRAIGRFRTAEGDAVWIGHGDASPASSQMRGAYLRHAETRAIARMLRMAVNVGMASVEELGGDDESSSVHAYQPTPRTSPAVRHERPPAVGTGSSQAAGPRGRDGGATAPVAPAVPGDEAAADGGDLPRVTCEWTTSDGVCGAWVEERLRHIGIERYGKVICREHAAEAKAFYDVQRAEQTLEMGGPEIVSAQAQGY